MILDEHLVLITFTFLELSMKNFLVFLTKNQALVYKIILFVSATLLILYILPKGGRFKYDFQKGKPWQHETLYAPFNFSVKTTQALLDNAANTQNTQTPFYEVNTQVEQNIVLQFNSVFDSLSQNMLVYNKDRAKNLGQSIMADLFASGLVSEIVDRPKVYLKRGNEVQEVTSNQLLTPIAWRSFVSNKIQNAQLRRGDSILEHALDLVLEPTVFFNARLTSQATTDNVTTNNPNLTVVQKGVRIIAKGEVVEGQAHQQLLSLREAYESKIWSKANFYWLLTGYGLLVSLVFLMLLLFLYKYRLAIFEDNTKVTFIFFNIVLMVFLTTFVINWNAKYLYVVPLCILPLILKAFFDPRLGLFVHVLTLLLLGFIVPNSFEYLFLQIIAGVVTILTVSELYKRANLFISVGQITIIYILGYFAFFIIREGNVLQITWEYFGYFILCGLITLFAHPLIYFYEKIFGLVSDVSLLELSDTNSKLLKELANKAPGTFHHSLNVANLCEAAASEINANAMLVRVGALYHDIGKMHNPTFFSENQVNTLNSLEELPPSESAKIIINHVLEGVELARKHKLPDRVIDFIRTHHGTSLVYYFYSKAKEENPDVAISEFQYKGPLPFSKETAILMMADSVEAASKSLKQPSYPQIENLVHTILEKQIEQGQFKQANITFKEIEQIKKVLVRKLANMYHLRVAYPE